MALNAWRYFAWNWKNIKMLNTGRGHRPSSATQTHNTQVLLWLHSLRHRRVRRHGCYFSHAWLLWRPASCQRSFYCIVSTQAHRSSLNNLQTWSLSGNIQVCHDLWTVTQSVSEKWGCVWGRGGMTRLFSCFAISRNFLHVPKSLRFTAVYWFREVRASGSCSAALAIIFILLFQSSLKTPASTWGD